MPKNYDIRVDIKVHFSVWKEMVKAGLEMFSHCYLVILTCSQQGVGLNKI